MTKYILSVALTLAAFITNAQQEPQYALYMFTRQALNPGSIATRGNFSAYSDYRSQWTKVEGTPETFNVGVQLAPNRGGEIGRHAAGLQLYHDRIGVSRTTALALQYAYRVPVSVRTMLSFGMQGMIGNYVNNLYQVRGLDANDPVQTTGINTNVDLNFGAGAYLYNERCYFGVSSPKLLENKHDLRGNDTRMNRRHYFVMGGYLQPVNQDLKLRFSTIFKYVPLSGTNGPASLDFNVSVMLFDRILAGPSYRTDNTITLLAQFQLNKSLNLGYAYDFKSGNYGSVAGNSHEIFLGVDMNALRGPFTTPRFVSHF